MATHYEGNAPDNAEMFWQWFSKEDEITSDWLKGYKYTVFALGDASYANFAKIGKETDRLLEKYGAQRVYKLGVGDDEEGKISKYFKDWKQDMWKPLAKEFVTVAGKSLENPEAVKASLFKTTLVDASQMPFEATKENSQNYNFKTQNFLSNPSLKIGKLA
jgi:sulfite reductase alpha subunit-like flavoprotein